MYFSRCCFCIPLRTGLLIWGYVKLILLILFIGAILLDDVNKGRYVLPVEYAITLIVVLLGTVDVIFTIIFIVACHKENRKLLLVYNGYTIAYLFLAALVLIGWVLDQMLDPTPNETKSIPTDLIVNAVLTIAYILCSAYMCLIIGSEIRNLDTRRGDVQYISPGRAYYNASEIAVL